MLSSLLRREVVCDAWRRELKLSDHSHSWALVASPLQRHPFGCQLERDQMSVTSPKFCYGIILSDNNTLLMTCTLPSEATLLPENEAYLLVAKLGLLLGYSAAALFLVVRSFKPSLADMSGHAPVCVRRRQDVVRLAVTSQGQQLSPLLQSRKTFSFLLPCFV